MALAVLALAAYGAAAWPARTPARWAPAALLVGWLAHFGLLVLDIGGFGQSQPGTRLGFAPVLSITVWLVIAVHEVEARLFPLSSVRLALAPVGAAAVLVMLLFPGELRVFASTLAPLHFALGVGSYGLFGAAVLHALMLDGAERRLRLRNPGAPAPGGLFGSALGLPLLQLERLTFRFVDAGFVVLSATLLLGALTAPAWRWDHKTVFSLLAWLVFAGLVAGRHLRGWRGRPATRWLYAGAVMLLLAYAGSRCVVEVLLARPAA